MSVWGSIAGIESNFPAHMAEKDDVRDTDTGLASAAAFLFEFEKYFDSEFFFELDVLGLADVLLEEGLKAVVLWLPESVR